MAKKAIVLLAEGFEEVETVTPIDYLRRAGVEVTVAAIANSSECEGSPVLKGSRGVQVCGDIFFGKLLPKACDWDAVVVPGGLNGANNIAACEKAGDFLKDMAKAGKLVCAICASPALVLSPLGILSGKKFTCYPSMEEKVADKSASFCGERVVKDGNIITSRAAGTTGEFAIAIIESLLDGETAKKVADSVLL
jgi:4-methyl-5(b-hydroxyethyl)-thiazole monophosphate biosynthesis